MSNINTSPRGGVGGVADVIKALVHHVAIATVWVRVQGAAHEKRALGRPLHRMCPNSPKKIRNNTGRSRCILRNE